VKKRIFFSIIAIAFSIMQANTTLAAPKMLRVWVNGTAVMDSKIPSNIKKATKKNLGKSIVIEVRDESNKTLKRSDVNSVGIKNINKKKLGKMFRVVINGQVIIDSQIPRNIRTCVKKIVKSESGDTIEIFQRKALPSNPLLFEIDKLPSELKLVFLEKVGLGNLNMMELSTEWKAHVDRIGPTLLKEKFSAEDIEIEIVRDFLAIKLNVSKDKVSWKRMYKLLNNNGTLIIKTLSLAKEGKVINSGNFEIGSDINLIQKTLGPPTDAVIFDIFFGYPHLKFLCDEGDETVTALLSTDPKLRQINESNLIKTLGPAIYVNKQNYYGNSYTYQADNYKLRFYIPTEKNRGIGYPVVTVSSW
jgi:uncharacterized protein (UPF0147 family)